MKHLLLVLVTWAYLLPGLGYAQSASVPTVGLSAYYPFDEVQGGIAKEATGQLPATTIAGGTWRTAVGYDRRGAVELPGVARVDIPLYWQPKAFTVTFWIYPTSLSNYSQQVKAVAGWSAFYFHAADKGQVYVGTDITHRLVFGTSAMRAGDWQHYTFTFDKGVGSLYKNGVLLGSRSDMALPQAWGGMTVGDRGDALYDELRIYNRALSASEVRSLAAHRPYLPDDKPNLNNNLNWTLERSFDGNGQEVAASKQFTDALGRATQAQARNAATQQVFAAQTVYSTGGQPVLQTMAAPIDNQGFSYKENFITAGGQPYGPGNFENGLASNPSPVDATARGTVGYYYSQLNEAEPLTPITGYPYSLTESYEGPMGGTRRAAGPGDELRMGKGREAKGRDFPLRKEFDGYLSLRPKFVPGSPIASLEYQGLKSVSINADGRESIVVTNKDGQAIISCLSGPQYAALPVEGYISAEGPTNPYDANAPAYQDIHLPAAGSQDVRFTMAPAYSGGGRVLIVNLLTDDTTSYAIKPATTGAAPERHVLLAPGFYRFISITGTQRASYEARYGDFSYTYYDDAGRVIATVAPNGFGGSNLLANPGLEQDLVGTAPPSGWQAYTGRISTTYSQQGTSTAAAHSGQFYGMHRNSETGGHNIYTCQVIKNLPNGLYTARAWVKNSGIAQNWPNQTASLLAKEYDNAGSQRGADLPITGSGGNWVRVQLTDIPVTNGQCMLGLYSISPTAEWIAFDDVELVRQVDTSSPTFTTRNTYDASSRLLATESTDEGRSEYVYAQDGRIRFSQSALQRPTGRFSYSNYDEVGRVVESGEYTPGSLKFENHLTASPAANSVLQPSLLEDRTREGGLVLNNCAQRNQVWYDLPFDGTDGSQGNDSQLGGRRQEFVVGAVAKTRNDNVKTWYSYDELGRVTWVVQDIIGVGVKTLDYQYDFSGNVLEVAYQKNQTDSFYHYYGYDAAQRLTSVNTSPNGTTRTLQAQYSYYLHGPLKRVQVADELQGIDYTYTLQGALKAINHVNQTLEPGHDAPAANGVYKDLFALTLDYFSGDYRSKAIDMPLPIAGGIAVPTRYDGTIQGAAWRTGASAGIHRVAYTYDEKSQLQNSQYGKWDWQKNSSNYLLNPASANALQEGNLRYDANGNIQSLRRTDQAGNVADDFSYGYKPNTNQLKEVHTGSAAGPTVLDYDYDELGQLVRQRDEKGQSYLSYDVSGKTTGFYADAARTQPIVTFAYDDRGFRVSKTTYANGVARQTTTYVRDVAGNILTVYEQPAPGAAAQRAEVPLYGASRLGSLTHLNDGTAAGLDDYRYELNDHLGDARVVFHRPTTTVDVETMELSGVSGRAAFLNDDRYRVAVSGAPSGDYVARLTDSQPAGQELKRVLSVSKGDTITFSALAQWKQNAAAGGNSTTPFILAGAAAGLAPLSQRGPEGQTAYQTNSPNWLSLLAAGLGFTLGGGNRAASLGSTSLTGWIKYRVLDATGNEQASGRDYLLGTGKWEYLQTGVRIEQAGTIEVMAGTSGSGEAVYFDNLRVEQSGGLIVQEQHQYAFGAPLPGLSYVVGSKRYRYGYQGQYAEHDSVTGFESFELRLYNSRVGRWLSYDPEGQFSSPYIGMGNNPASGVDPDGGWSSGWKPLAKGLHRLKTGEITGSISRAGRLIPAAASTAVRSAANIRQLSASNRMIAQHGSISPTKTTFTREWAKGNWFSFVVNYHAVNTFYLAPQIFNPNPRNFDGTPSSLSNRSSATFSLLGMAIVPEGEAEQLYEIGDGIRRAKAMQLAGHKTIQAQLNSGEIITIQIKNLRSFLKTSLPNDLRFKKVLDSFMSGAKQEAPIYVNPGGRGVPVSEINVQ